MLWVIFNPIYKDESDIKSGILVAQTVASWNQTVHWLREMDLLRRDGIFRAA
jgi:hypothetical protein